MAPTLATVADLAAHLQRDFDAADAYTAGLALDAASALVRAYLRQDVTQVADDAIALTVPRDGLLRLPQRPVTSISSVTQSTNPVPYVQLGTDAIGVDPLRYFGFLVTVVYSHGYAAGQIPGDVRGVVLDVAGRRMENPRGLASENMGAYSYTSKPGPAGLNLTPEERRTLDRSPLGRPGSGVAMVNLA